MKISIRSLMLLAFLIAVLSFHWHRNRKKRQAAAAAVVQSLVEIETQLHRRVSQYPRFGSAPPERNDPVFFQRQAVQTRAKIQAICERWNLKEPAPSFGPPLELE